MNILNLTLKKKWFNMILSGIKKQEYREIKKYWSDRLTEENHFKKYDIIVFKNGYKKQAPTIFIECLSINIDYGNKEWGAEDNIKYFVIYLGNIIKTEFI